VYHEVTSDEYFGSIAGHDDRFDVIYLDGLHTFEQTLRDLLNALEHLQPKGVIVIDDVRPPSFVASIPDLDVYFPVRNWLGVEDKSWMGDVYRLVWFMDTFCQQLSFRTISNNHGQAVVWRQRRTEVPERRVADVGDLTFDRFVMEQRTLRPTRFNAIFKLVREHVQRG
jgi:hypothetical protein